MSRYPDGVTGVALLLMRLSHALLLCPLLARLPFPPSSWGPTAIASAIALALVAGLGTQVAALLLALGLAANIVTASGDFALILAAPVGGACALALLGPGAYSIDAHLFGRRVIKLKPRPPDRGGDD